MSFRGLDARAQLAVLAALLLAALAGGPTGVIACAIVAAVWTIAVGAVGVALRSAVAVLPLAGAVAILDALAGRPDEGVFAGARLVAIAILAIAFARTVDARAMADGLRALRIPYPIVFVLVAGARFVPAAAADLADLTDAARLRGLTISGGAWRRMADWTVLLVPLLVITIKRGLQLGEAMEARAFGAAARTSIGDLRWRTRDSAAVATAVVALATVLLIGSLVR